MKPHLVDQSAVFESQFKEMTDNAFNYDDFETTREQLIKMINESLTVDDKEFLLAFVKGKPTWDKVDYRNFPAIKW